MSKKQAGAAAGRRGTAATSDGGAAAAREEAKRETRDALLAAAFAEFVEHGFDVPSLDAICARAGYTRGAFYVHFKDRDELIVAVMQSVLGTFLDAVIGAGEGSDDLEQTVLRFAGAIVGGNPLTGGAGSMRTHHLLDVCARSPVIRARFLEMLGEAQRRLADAAAAGQAAGTVRADVSAAAVASVLIALAMGVIQLFELGVPLPVAEVQAAVLQVLRRRGAS